LDGLVPAFSRRVNGEIRQRELIIRIRRWIKVQNIVVHNYNFAESTN
jgi:hypothetical protein